MNQILLLSSFRLFINKPSFFQDTFGKPMKDFKMAYVINATKGVTGTGYFERNKKFFAEQGVKYTKVDLDGFKEPELRELLSNFDLVYVEGGNSFYLLKSIRESGFDKVVKGLLPKGLIYMGASAGSYVACPSIEMATWKHQDKYDHCGVTDLTGMGLVPFLVTVHYKPEYEELIKEKIAHANYPVKILTDEQALLVQDGQVRLWE